MIGLALFVTACVPEPPKNQDNVCEIFSQYPEWYWAAQDTQREWGVPISVQMAIIHQESHFKGTAKPPREKLLWVIPWKRPTSAYGYSQALDKTWQHYKRMTGRHGSRDEFEAAADFIGWYATLAHARAGIAKDNAYALYLAYHEGIGGYIAGSYRQKAWLMTVAHAVSAEAALYQSQLAVCAARLPRKPWWRLW